MWKKMKNRILSLIKIHQRMEPAVNGYFIIDRMVKITRFIAPGCILSIPLHKIEAVIMYCKEKCNDLKICIFFSNTQCPIQTIFIPDIYNFYYNKKQLKGKNRQILLGHFLSPLILS